MNYIACVFLKEGIESRQPSPLADVDCHCLESALAYVERYLRLGIRDFLVFGSTDNKSIDFACDRGLIKRFIREAKALFGNRIVIHADVGLSPYAADGHSTIIENGQVNTAKSYAQASRLALAFAEAGANYVAPCLSLHQQVGVLRTALDEAGHHGTRVHGYTSKFSSSLYGPYRKTIQSPLSSSSRKAYQSDYSDATQALSQIEADEAQGAAIIMVKPAMIYLDIVYQARQRTRLPLSVYHVSGEYSMMKMAAAAGLVDEGECFDEVHAGFQRCGADYVIGYAPDHFLRWKKTASGAGQHVDRLRDQALA